MMAQMQTQGLPVDVAGLMDSLANGPSAAGSAGVTTPAAGQQGQSVTGLLAGLKKERRFVA